MADFFDSDPVRNYMNEINRFPIFSIEKQKELANLYIQNHDLNAKKLLIESNLRLVVSIAKKYCYQVKHLKFLDLIQEGNAALVAALEQYDPSKSAFSTFASEHIEGEISRSIASKEYEIRKPEHIIRGMNKYNYLVSEYQKKREPLPSDEELCNILGVSLGILNNIRNAINQRGMSLSEPLAEDMTIADLIPDDNNDIDNIIDEIYFRELILVVKELLSPCDYYLFYIDYLAKQELSRSVVAKNMGICGERVRQKLSRIRKTIKPYLLENSIAFGHILQIIKEREQEKISFLKLEPINPQDIVKYLYIQDELTEQEKKLYELLKFSKYNYPKKELLTILKVDWKEYEELLTSLKNKIKMKFQDLKSYKIFEKEILQTYKSNIFNLIEGKNNILIRKKDI